MKYYIWIILCAILASCGVKKQIDKMSTFSKCEFRLLSLVDAKLAGVDVQNVKSISDINMINMTQLSAAYAKGALPLDFTLNVEVKNPNPKPAGMTMLDWILLIDNKEMLNGVLKQRVDIAPNGGTAVLPVKMSMDLRKVIQSGQLQEVINIAFNLAGASNKPSQKVRLKVKPTINVGGIAIKYPGYFTVSDTFTAQ